MALGVASAVPILLSTSASQIDFGVNNWSFASVSSMRSILSATIMHEIG